MSTKVASLYAEIGAKIDGFQSGANQVVAGLAGIAARYLSVGAAVAALTSAIKFSVDAAMDAQKVDAQLEAVLRSTGNAAGLTKQQLNDLATSLAEVSTFDDEAIKSTEALLLTFTSVGKDIFPQATRAILDMSIALGQDLKSTAIQVGKALQDPILGITALRRVGVNFNGDQKELIKTMVETGHTLDAQKYILRELSNEFGGSAAAAAETYAGKVDILKNRLEDLGEVAGNLVLPAGTRLTDMAIDLTEAFTDLADNGFGYSRDKLNVFSLFADFANERIAKGREEIIKASDAVAAHGDALDGAAQAVHNLTVMTEDEIKAEENAEKAWQQHNEAMLNGIMDITKENKNYIDSQEEIRDKQLEITIEINKLIEQGWSPLSEKVQDLQKDYDDLGDKFDENATKHKARTDQIILDMALEKIAMLDGVKGFSDAEYQKALAVATTMGAAEEAAVREQMAFDQVTTAVANGSLAVGDLKTAIDMLQDKTVTITTVLETINQQDVYGSGTGLTTHGQGNIHAHASGGMFEVPSSYGNEGFKMGNNDSASGGELISIAPKGQQGWGGNNFTFYISADYADPETIANRLKPAVTRVMREAGVV